MTTIEPVVAAREPAIRLCRLSPLRPIARLRWFPAAKINPNFLDQNPNQLQLFSF
jgi:hypothetical protein